MTEYAGWCPGNCNARSRRLSEVYRATRLKYDQVMATLPEDASRFPPPEPPQVRPWYGEPVWCSKCASQIRLSLSQLDHLAALRVSQEPGSRPPDDDVRVTRSRGQPSASPMLDDVQELTDWALQWEEVVAGDNPVPRHGLLAQVRTEVLAWLYERCDNLILLNGDISADFGAEVRQWHRELISKTSSGTGMKHLKQPCPRCGEYQLWQESGAEYAQCKNQNVRQSGEPCGRLLNRADLEGLDEAARSVSRRYWRASPQDRQTREEQRIAGQQSAELARRNG